MEPSIDRQKDRQNKGRHLVAELEKVFDALRPGIPQEWFTLDLTMPQLRVLFLLLDEGTCRMGVLASHLGISLSGATGLMDRLVEKGLAQRWVNPKERRSVMAELTPKGRELAERLLHLRRAQWKERLKALTDEEVQSALQGLKALAQGLAQHRSVTKNRCASRYVVC